MENTKQCQSCSMPLEATADFGTEKDGSQSQEYCCYCYQNGSFEGGETTLEEMIEVCASISLEEGYAKTLEEAKAHYQTVLPTLKRWKN